MLPAAACLLGRFRILGQSECRAEGQAHFCDRLCLPPTYQVQVHFIMFFVSKKMIFNIIFQEFPISWRGATKGNNLKSILWLHIAMICYVLYCSIYLCILAAYRCFQIWNSVPDEKVIGHCKLFGCFFFFEFSLAHFVTWPSMCKTDQLSR